MVRTPSSRLRSWLPMLAGVLLAGTAHAASLPFTATLAIQLAEFDPILIPGAGTAILNGSAGGAHIDSLALAGATFAGGDTLPITDPSVFPVRGIDYDVQNSAGSFTRGSGSRLGGVMPLLGSLRICLFGPCSTAIANLDVPLTLVGGPGSYTQVGAVYLTVAGAPWTTGTATVASAATAMGLAHGPASGTSSTFAPGGRVQLVTPFVIASSLGALPILPGSATLTIQFLPEPATFALLAGGVALLGVIGRARRD
jgi:hypothetical protein